MMCNTLDEAACCCRASSSSRAWRSICFFRSVKNDLVRAAFLLGAFGGSVFVTAVDLRVFAALLLPPALDGRAILAPWGQPGHLIGQDPYSGRAEKSLNRACQP